MPEREAGGPVVKVLDVLINERANGHGPLSHVQGALRAHQVFAFVVCSIPEEWQKCAARACSCKRIVHLSYTFQTERERERER